MERDRGGPPTRLDNRWGLERLDSSAPLLSSVSSLKISKLPSEFHHPPTHAACENQRNQQSTCYPSHHNIISDQPKNILLTPNSYFALISK